MGDQWFWVIVGFTGVVFGLGLWSSVMWMDRWDRERRQRREVERLRALIRKDMNDV